MNLKKSVKLYVEMMKINNYTELSIKKYESDLNMFIQYFSNKKYKLQDIETEDIKKYLTFILEEEKLSINTVKHKRQVIKGFFDYYFQQEVININPYSNIKGKRLDSIISD